ncbi:dihydrodipicolinate synthase family protein [Catenulispora sp. NF23]|uniref:dihydrodipicolinate synthase family protein n=1 Tax=Catenulispora pinistramenti TaxID=2705254 RepID=UPI001BA95DED|nr:dihydrodipicolinate synthase family protein [Catenulispora pinistramenti]MBS2539727.1 dihydrodipicolinate synthase family protein [Catenulispora pinistramenti]
MSRMPWHGVVVATALPFRDDLSVDLDAYAANLRALIDAGCDGVCPNGSLGEYQTLTDAERAAVVKTAVDTVGGDRVLAGVAAYGSMESRRWAEQAAQAGAQAVMLLPPNAYRADERSVLAHYKAVAEVGVPIVAYNNPIDTKVDLVPELLQKLHEAGYIRAVKEFTGDTRRAYRIKELTPDLDLLIGADDVLLELALAGAVGWISGYPNAIPHVCVDLYRAATTQDMQTALPLYRDLHPLLRWDSRTEFVQAIKLSMDLAGLHGGGCRPPRVSLLPDQYDAIKADTLRVLPLEEQARERKQA